MKASQVHEHTTVQTLERTKVYDFSHTILYTHAALPAKSPLRGAAALATAATLAASHGFPSVQKLLLFLKFQAEGRPTTEL